MSNARKDAYEYYGLKDTTALRNDILKYYMPIDEKKLKEWYDDISRSENAGNRLGREWLPNRHSKIEVKDESDNSWLNFEEIRPLNDSCTKWCTATYFPEAYDRINMVANVTRLYTQLAKVSGLDFDIVFKGGVMARVILLEFLQELPYGARMEMLSHLNSHNALSMSDFDFEIVPKEHDSPTDLIHRLFRLDYAVLLWFQNELDREVKRNKIFEPGLLNLNWDKEAEEGKLKARLQETVNGLEATHPLYKARVDYVFLSDTVPEARRPKGYISKNGESTPRARKNVCIFQHEGQTCVLDSRTLFEDLGVHNVPHHSGGERFYSTLNSYIGDCTLKARPDHLISLFHLARIKHAFVIYYTTRRGEKRCDRLGGEIVDLSQSHGTHLDPTRRKLYSLAKVPYHSYKILGVDPDSVSLRSYSIEGFLFDHMLMLHHGDVPPWEANKFQKRTARYVAFFVAHVLGPYVAGTHADKVRALVQLTRRCASIEELLARGYESNIPAIRTFYERERASLETVPSKHRSAAKRYLRVLHAHLVALIGPIVAHPRLVRTHLASMSRT